jgi:(4S)-4-hydroxy-5-phosphonooxypentane-2,3-dione isomerase
MFAQIVRLQVKPEARERFLAAMEDNWACSLRDEPGCFTFHLIVDQTDPNRFYAFEIYRDAAAVEAHRNAPHYARFVAAAGDTIVEKERIACDSVFPPDSPHWEGLKAQAIRFRSRV